MDTNNFSPIKISSRRWNLLLISGILLIVMGIWVIFTPESSLIALGLLFATTFFLAGVFEIAYAISNKKLLENWVWNLTIGFVDLAVGFLLFVFPELTLISLLLFVSLSLVFRSVLVIIWAIFLREIKYKHWIWVLILGIIILIFSAIIFFNPAFTGFIVIFFLSFTLITIGLIHIYLALTMKRLTSKFFD